MNIGIVKPGRGLLDLLSSINVSKIPRFREKTGIKARERRDLKEVAEAME